MQIFLSVVMGLKGSGVSTLLKVFAARADMQATTIVDHDDRTINGSALPKDWNADDIGPWLHRLRIYGLDGLSKPSKRLVLASSDLKAPRHLVHALAADPELSATFRLDGVTLATEAAAAGPDLDQRLARAAAIADRIVLTKTDRLSPAAVKPLAAQLKALNPPAPILRASHGDLGPARLVDSGLFDPVAGSVDIDRWLCEAAFGWEATRRGTSSTGLNGSGSSVGRLAAARGFRSFAITLDQPIGSTVLSVFLKLLMADRGADLLRMKGIIATEEHPERPALIDGTEHIIQPLFWLPHWPTADRRSRLVFMTTDMSETWIRSLLTTLSDQLGPAGAARAPELALLDASMG